MSLAYRCDLCGDFVSNEADAERERVLASQDTTISNTTTTLTISLDAGKNHVCDRCFNLAKQKVKQWVQNNL